MTVAASAANGTSMAGADARLRGQAGYHSGQAAEACVARDYARRGYPLLAQRWRGKGGEIDLIFRDGAGVVFVEVKQSQSVEKALRRVTPRQVLRLLAAGEEFLGTQPMGTLTEVRFDVAAVDGLGDIHVIENAIGHP